MLTPHISSQPKAAGVPVTLDAALAAQHRKDATATQLEGMFAAVLIKTMRQTVGEEGLFPGDSADVLGSLFDQYMADEISSGGGLGVADAFRSEL